MALNKFEQARFFNVGLNSWQIVTIDNYSADIHSGKLVCPNECCNGSIKHTGAHTKNASNTNVDAFFSTNGDGESHEYQCPHNPDPTIKNVHKMRDLLKGGKGIVININFSTSYSKEKGKLFQGLAKESMNRVGGFLYKDWIKENKGQYGVFSASNVEQMADRIAMFREASKGLDVSPSRLKFAYLHGLVSLSDFYSRDGMPELRANSSTIFQELHEQMQADKKDILRFWRGFPALKKEVQLFVNARKESGQELDANSNKSQNTVKINGQEFLVKDVIKITDEKVKQVMQSARTFNFVATPYIKRKDVERTIDRGYKSVPLHWPITSLRQITVN
jgi:hypothetical protein